MLQIVLGVKLVSSSTLLLRDAVIRVRAPVTPVCLARWARWAPSSRAPGVAWGLSPGLQGRHSELKFRI